MADASLVKEVREVTGLSFDKIGKALDEVGGDKEKAIALLMSQAGDVAAKKAERQVKDGLVVAYVHGNGKIGAMVQLACETDFVARNDDFKNLAKDLAMHASAMNPATPEEMLEQSFVKDPSLTVRDLINQAVAKLGENIQLSGVSVLMIG